MKHFQFSVRVIAAAAIWVAAPTATLAAQPVRRDTLFLDVLQHAAETTDRRAVQMEVLSAQSALRLQNIQSEWKPTLGVVGTAQYLSDVTSFGRALPAGFSIPTPYHEQFDSYLTAREPLYDASRNKRTVVEAAQTAESAARVRSALFQQRQQVNDAFFALQQAEVQGQALQAMIADLESRRRSAQARVTNGSALPSEAMLLDAEIARRQQAAQDAAITRDATREVLALLTGTDVSPNSVFAVRIADAADSATDTVRARPEYQQFARSRDLIEARAQATATQDLPRVSLVGRLGYGRPGLNALGRSFDSYYTAGVQVEWMPFTWGRTRRELETQRMQQRIVNSEEASFSDALQRTTTMQRAQIQALAQSLTTDDSIVALRERVRHETQLRFDEGEVTSAEYIARLTELTAAQLDRDARRIRLSEARARYLTTLGREVR